MEKWDYWVAQVEVLQDDNQTKRLLGLLRDLGDEGWELVSVTQKTSIDPSGVDQYTLFFKRPARI